MISKTLNPEWNVSFEMPVVGVPLLECICWDHDRFGKDYMGEFDIALEDIFADGQVNQEVRGYTAIGGIRLRRINANDRPAHLVHPEVETGIQPAQPQKEEEGEEGQQCLWRDPTPILALRFSKPGRLTCRNIS